MYFFANDFLWFFENKQVFVHNEEEIVFLRTRFPIPCCLAIMLHFHDVFLESETDAEESFHDLECHWLIHLFSTGIPDENRTIISFFKHTKTFFRYFLHLISKLVDIVNI